MPWTIGVDVGGTFTDTTVINDQGEIYYSKVSTTPGRLEQGILNSLVVVSENIGVSVEDLLKNTQRFAHGTTQTVNAVVQYKGSKTGFITTKGFRDHLLIMRGGRGVGLPDSEKAFFNRVTKPAPLVPYELCEEVTERVDYEGRIICPLNEQETRKAVRTLLAKGVESIGISFLWSFKNQEHEQRARKIVQEEDPDTFVTISSEIAPVLGEYERSATTITNCYVGRILRNYVQKLQMSLNARGLKQNFFLMQSVGGLIPGNEAPNKAASTVLSGLAGGIIGSQYLGKLLGFNNIINTDMGGTSYEVGIIYEGIPLIAPHPLFPRLGPYVSRYHLSIPMIDITAIGAGGGSIARTDGKSLRVGPDSASAEPGPACYMRGGTEPTVTDANLVLGFLDPFNFLGGKMKVDKKLSEQALKKVSEPLGIDNVDAAKGIYEVVNTQMTDLTRSLTLERGFDPRDFMLFAYGGAGPLHCAVYGAGLGVRGILVPGKGLATAHSAFGVATSDLKQSFALSDYVVLPTNEEKINGNFRKLEQNALDTLKRWGVKREDIVLMRSLDMRFKRQTHEVEIEVPSRELTKEDIDQLGSRFEEKYELLFGKGTSYREAGVEMTTFRVDAVGKIWKPSLRKFDKEGQDSKHALKEKRMVFSRKADDFQDTPIYIGEKLRSGNKLSGPAVIEYLGTTIVVHDGQSAMLDPYINVIIDTRGEVGN